jgi:hypothetical protein
MDVPPLQESPLAQQWPGSIPKITKAVADWDSRLDNLASKFRASHSDAMVTLFSTNKLFSAILADPTQFKQTIDMKIVDPEYCAAYTE